MKRKRTNILSLKEKTTKRNFKCGSLRISCRYWGRSSLSSPCWAPIGDPVDFGSGPVPSTRKPRWNREELCCFVCWCPRPLAARQAKTYNKNFPSYKTSTRTICNERRIGGVSYLFHFDVNVFVVGTLGDDSLLVDRHVRVVWLLKISGFDEGLNGIDFRFERRLDDRQFVF